MTQPRIIKTYPVSPYSEDPHPEDTLFQRHTVALRMVVEGDMVYLQTDPYEEAPGEMVIRRIAEFHIDRAMSVLLDSFKY